MTSIVLKNCTLLNSDSPELQENIHILITDDRITEVSETPIKSSTAHVIDVKGKTVMPGLIDAHVHLIATTVDLSKLINEPASLTVLRAHKIAEDMLMRGFTSVRDAAGADWGLTAAIDQGIVAGPRVFFAGKALSQTGGHGDFRPRTAHWDHCTCFSSHYDLSIVADGVSAVRKAAREELRKGASQIKIMASGGVASPTDPIWNLQYSEEEIRAIVWEAQSCDKYVMAHAYTSEAVTRAIEYGVRCIEHGNLIDKKTAQLMVRKDAFLIPTLVTLDAMQKEGTSWGLPQVSMDKLQVVRKAGLDILEMTHKEGVKVGFGTDLLGELHHYQSLEFSIRAQILTPFEVIQSATVINAELVKRTGELGVIQNGALADILVVDGNPLEDLNLLQEQGKHLPLIMKGGKAYKNTLV